MAQRDAFDLWNSISAHRTAGAAKQSAAEFARIAKAQEQSAASNRAIAEARRLEAHAADRAAKAAEYQTQILQEKHNQQRFLSQAKSILVNLSRSLNRQKVDLNDLSPSDIVRIVTDQNALKDSDPILRDAFVFEQSVSEQEQLFEILDSAKKNSEELSKNPKIAAGKTLAFAIRQCVDFESEIKEQITKIECLQSSIVQNIAHVNKYLSLDPANSIIPSKDIYYGSQKEKYELVLNTMLSSKLVRSVLGFPMIASGVVTLFILGMKYSIFMFAVGAFALFLNKKSDEKLIERYLDYRRSVEAYDRLAGERALLEDSSALLTAEKEALANGQDALVELIQDIKQKGVLSSDFVDELVRGFGGTRFLGG